MAHLTALKCPPPELVYVAARVGYDSVSLRTIPLGVPGEPEYELASNRELLRKTRVALTATGISVSDIELACIHDDVDVRGYQAAFEVAQSLGARDVLCSIWARDRGFYVDQFAALCELAGRYHLRVNLEFVAIAAVRTLTQAVDVLQAVGAPNSGLLLDAYHVDRAGTRVEDLAALPRHWFNLCQLCDAPAALPQSEEGLRVEVREQRLYLGEGGLDVAGLLALTPPMTYSLEVPNLARLEELGAAEHAARTLDSARRYLGEHPRAAAG
ncbi:TIM barrel protein [Angustibacter luteus]